MKPSKRILSVKIKRMMEDYPDTSYLGKYSNRAETEFAIDRAHSEDCASLESNHRQTVDTLERIIGHLDKIRVSPEVADNPDSTEWEALDAALDLLIELQSEAMECDCGGHNVSSREYRYFNFASGCPFDKSGMESKDAWRAEMQKYARQDYERMESYNNQNWHYIGIRAEAEIAIPGGKMSWNHASTIQYITSGGLWGIESDSDKEYIADVEKQELADLKTQLLTLGFSKRAISTAFKNVQEVSE